MSYAPANTSTGPATPLGRAGQIKIAVALVLVGGAIGLFVVLTRVPAVAVPPEPCQALGQVLAEEAAKVLGPDRRVALIAPNTSVFPNPAADHLAEGFFRAARSLQFNIVGTNWIELDPIRLVRVPPGDYLEVLLKRSANDVVVSFLGPPLLSDEQRAKLAGKAPRIVALCAGNLPRQTNLKALFERNLLHVAVISRPNPAAGQPTTQGARAWFDQFYQIVTRANLADLPTPP